MGHQRQEHVLLPFTSLYVKCRDVTRALCLGGVRLNLPEFRRLISYSNALKQCPLAIYRRWGQGG